MKKSMLWPLLAALAAGPVSAQEEVNLDDLVAAPAPVAPRAAQNLVFNLYADFDLQIDVQRDDKAHPPTLAFLRNHIDLLVQGDYQGRVKVDTDVFNASKLLEVTVALAPGQSVRFGRIMIPFGEFNLHHIYGGKDDQQELLLPQLWTDLGVSYKTQLDAVSLETYVLNGFNVADNGTEPDPNMGGNPHNWAKALGVQVRWDVAPGTLLSLSALNHEFDQTVFQGKDVLYAGADAATKLGPVTLKAGVLWGQVWTRDEVGLPLAYAKWGTYAESRVTVAPQLDVRLRAGQMDPDTRADNFADQWNVNAALLWHFDVMDVNLVVFHNQETWSTGVQPNNTNQVLLKFLVAL